MASQQNVESAPGRVSVNSGSKTARVLVIDDQPEILELLTNVLRAKRIEVEAAATATAGIEAARKNVVDLVLLDLGLPDMSGLDVIRKLRQVKSMKHVPVIILTGRETTEDKLQAFELGVIDYINKPFNVVDVQVRVTAAVERKRAQDRANALTLREQKRTQAELHRISKAVDSASDAICILDEKATVCYVNDAFTELFHIVKADMEKSERQEELFVDPKSWLTIWQTCHAGQSWAGEAEMLSTEGHRFPVLCRADAILGEGGEFLGLVVLYTDITLRKRLEQDLIHLANHDSLTALFNRRHFTEALQSTVERARNGIPSSLLYLDLDNFKVINDFAGHAAGDRLLQQIAQILRDHTRPGDCLARFGGDEFTVLLHGSNEEEAMGIAQRIRRRLDDFRFVEAGKAFSASASIGIAPVDGSVSPEDVLAQADCVCHLVKSKGRNDCEVFRPDNQEVQRLSSEANWSIRIKDALREDRMEVWLQPILPLKGQIRVYFEALLRMRDKDGKLCMPGEFLNAAERFGNMLQIDQCVIKKSIDLLQKFPELQLSLNLSAKSLNDPNLPQFIERLLRDAEVHPERVSFEITETALIQSLAQARLLILEIKKLGCRFALDDFGSGASSMMYLRDLPVDYLKIDGSFIRHLDTDPINRALVRSINEVAHVLGKQTVAEYVTNAAVLQQVQELDIDYAQGWYICEPAPPSTLLAAGEKGQITPLEEDDL